LIFIEHFLLEAGKRLPNRDEDRKPGKDFSGPANSETEVHLPGHCRKMQKNHGMDGKHGNEETRRWSVENQLLFQRITKFLHDSFSSFLFRNFRLFRGESFG